MNDLLEKLKLMGALLWIVFSHVLLPAITILAITYMISISNLPDWFKFYLLSK